MKPCLLALAAAVTFAAASFAQDPKGTDPKPAQPPKVDFATQVWPILEKRCTECHFTPKPEAEGQKPKKPKGGVVLDSKDGFTSGKKKLVVGKKPEESLLYRVVTLPADDEDRMPPRKKGEPLAKEQTDLIKAWIEQGADLGKWTGPKKADTGDKPGPDQPKDGKQGPAHGGGAEKPKAPPQGGG